jgi:hypothetical protein
MAMHVFAHTRASRSGYVGYKRGMLTYNSLKKTLRRSDT